MVLSFKSICLYIVLFPLLLVNNSLMGQECACSLSSDNLTVVNGEITVVNAYYSANANSLAGATTISLDAERANGANGTIAAGDVLLVIQMQGVEINASLPDQVANGDYADGAGANDRSGFLETEDFIAGQYEYVIATNSIGNTGGTLTLKTALQNSYVHEITPANFSATQGRQTFQVVRIGNFSQVDIQAGGIVTGLPWDGRSGGIIAIDALTSMLINGTINANSLGFRGGARLLSDGGGGGSETSIFTSQIGVRGEGIAGTPDQVYTFDNAPLLGGTLATLTLGASGYAGTTVSVANPRTGNTTTQAVQYTSSRGAGAPGNAGGAGRGDGSGGGGSNGGLGGNGGFPGAFGGAQNQGIGGFELDLERATRAFLGGGGGSGGIDNDAAGAGSFDDDVASGQPGGGIILIRANALSGAGNITSNGTSGGAQQGEGSGGGGAGGTVVVVTDTEDLSGINLNATGGNGSVSNDGGDAGGGGGSGGNVLLIRRGGTFLNIPTVSVTGGTGGLGAGTLAGLAGNGGFETTSIPPPSTLDCPLINLPDAAPGGVLDDLILWLDAGENVTFDGANEVSQWQGLSANGFTLSNEAFGVTEGTPDFTGTGTTFNTNPFISFNNEGALNDFLGFTNFTNFPTDNLTFFIVLNSNNTTGTQSAASYFDGTENDFNLDLVNGTNVAREVIVGNNTDGTSDIRDGFTRIVATDYENLIGATDEGRVFINNLLETTEIFDGGQLTQGGQFVLGQDIDNSTDGGFNTAEAFVGDIAEVIMYFSDPLSDNERQMISSYLAIKYGVTLDQSTNQDYLNSIGESIYPTLSENAIYGAYDNDIAGIGRDDGAALDQRQSLSINNDGLLTGSINSFSTDRQFLVWGNDNGALTFNMDDISADVIERLARKWRVSVENGLSNSSLSFDFSSGVTNVPAATDNLVLLIDDDGIFANGVTQQVSVSSWDGTTAIFDNITFNDEAIFTIGVVSESPGGVSANLVTWLRADEGVLTAGGIIATDGTTADTWTDQSLAGNSGAEDGNAPIYRDNATNNINGNPVIELDGTDDRLVVQLNGIKNSSYYLFSVGARADAANENYILGSNGAGNNEVLHFGYRNNNVATIAHFSDDLNLNGLNAFNDPANTPFLLTAEHDQANGSILQENRDSQLSVNTDAGIGDLTGARVDYVGFYNDNSYFGGTIGEVIAYSSTLSDNEEQRIDSYLSLKYGITMNNGDTDYLSSNSIVIFPATSSLPDYTIFNNDIAGIGRDDLSGLNQLSSTSENIDAILTLSISSFANNTQFLVWGNDNDNQGLGATAGLIEEVSVDIPTNVPTRLDREWRVENTNAASGVTVSFDITGITVTGIQAEDFTLMIDQDGDFTDGFVRSIEASSFVGNVVTFDNVTFDGDDIFALGTSRVADAPGGITAGISLWLRADRGVVDNAGNLTWSDQSGNGNNATQTGGVTTTGASMVNSNNVIDANNLNRVFTTGTLNGQTIIYAGAASTTGNENFSGYLGFDGDTGIRQNMNGEDNFRNPGNAGDFSNAGAYYFNGDVNTSTNVTNVSDFHVGVSQRGAGAINDDFFIGGYFTNRFYTGNTQYGDVIVYDDILTDTERIRVESYLGIKYGVTLGGGDFDYECSDGTITYPASTNAEFLTFRSDIAGIGRDDASDFEQLTSKSINSTAILQVNKDASFVADKQYFVWGNNGVDITSSANLVDVPSGIESRLGREWRVNISNNPSGTVDLQFDLTDIIAAVSSPSDLRLLIDNDGVFSNATVLSPIVSQAGNLFTFENVDLSSFSDQDIFTVGSISVEDSALPLDFLSFNGKNENGSVSLTWETTNEINVSHFEILRTYNGVNFEEIGTLPAVNLEAGINVYNFTDLDPGIGEVFYQLRQVDFDGKSEKSIIILVQVNIEDASLSLNLFPNPAVNSQIEVGYIGNGRVPFEMNILDVSGKNVWNKAFDASESSDNFINLGDYIKLNQGIYIFTLKQGNEIDRKRFIIK